MTKTIANIEVELVEENGKFYVYMANDGSSGVKYEYKNADDLQALVGEYAAECHEYNMEEE